jgi:hypothetical protein
VEQHSIILKGDDTEYPPKPGVMTVLKQISDQLSHPESGNVALYKSMTIIQNTDARRLSFLNGAKWVTVLLWTAGGFAVGVALAVLKGH